MSPLRRRLAVDLIEAYGIADQPGVERMIATSATGAEIERVHAPAYVKAVRRYSAEPILASTWEAAQWGLAAGGDTPALAPTPGPRAASGI